MVNLQMTQNKMDMCCVKTNKQARARAHTHKIVFFHYFHFPLLRLLLCLQTLPPVLTAATTKATGSYQFPKGPCLLCHNFVASPLERLV